MMFGISFTITKSRRIRTLCRRCADIPDGNAVIIASGDKNGFTVVRSYGGSQNELFMSFPPAFDLMPSIEFLRRGE